MNKTRNQSLINKRSVLYKELKDIDTKRNSLENSINCIINKISVLDEKISSPKMYYPELDNFYTADEIIELECFFNKSNNQLISTELTDLTLI